MQVESLTEPTMITYTTALAALFMRVIRRLFSFFKRGYVMRKITLKITNRLLIVVVSDIKVSYKNEQMIKQNHEQSHFT